MKAATTSVFSPERQLCGFWQRIAAYLVDGLVVFALVVGVSYLNFQPLGLNLPSGSFSFLLSLSYFGFLNSRVGGGQTIGKRLVRIRVVTREGATLTLPRSLLRYLVLSFYLHDFSFAWQVDYTGAVRPSALAPLLGLGVDSLRQLAATCIAVLYVVNRATRQSLHDLVVGSYVVNANVTGPLALEPFKRPFLWLGLVAALVFSVSAHDWYRHRSAVRYAYTLEQALNETWEGARVREVRPSEPPTLDIALPYALIASESDAERIDELSEQVLDRAALAFLDTQPGLETTQTLNVKLSYQRRDLFGLFTHSYVLWPCEQTFSVATWHERLGG